MQNRRTAIATITAIGTASIAGCVTGKLVDTTYECDITEPNTTPEAETPTIGDNESPVTIELHIDLSRGPTRALLNNILDPIYENHIQEGEVQLKIYDALVESNNTWAFELASALRYIYITGREEAYLATIREILQDGSGNANVTWQSIGNGAAEHDIDPCTAISHGKYKSYENRSNEDRQIMLQTELAQSPAVIVGGERITEMTPFSEVYSKITDIIAYQVEE